MDLAQERHLALIEGTDPDAAVRAYRSREYTWRRTTVPFLLDGDADEEAA